MNEEINISFTIFNFKKYGLLIHHETSTRLPTSKESKNWITTGMSEREREEDRVVHASLGRFCSSHFWLRHGLVRFHASATYIGRYSLVQYGVLINVDDQDVRAGNFVHGIEQEWFLCITNKIINVVSLYISQLLCVAQNYEPFYFIMHIPICCFARNTATGRYSHLKQLLSLPSRSMRWPQNRVEKIWPHQNSNPGHLAQN